MSCNRVSIHRVPSARLPARFVSTRSGLFFEWNLACRAKVDERAPLLIDDAKAWQLKMDLLKSTWRAPPSLQTPEHFKGRVRHLSVADLSLADLQRAWTQAVMALHGRAVFRLCLTIYPRHAHLFDLHRVAAHRQTLLARFKERPALAPLMGQDPGMWNSFPNWQCIKRRLLALGLNPQAWRWLNHQPRAYIAKMAWSSLGHLAWANFHAALGRALPVSSVDAQTGALAGFGGLAAWLRRNHQDLCSPLALNVLRATRLAMLRRAQATSRTHQKELEAEEFPLIVDWLLGVSRQHAPSISRHWTYDTLMAKQSHWHLVERNWNTGRPDVFWPQVLGMGMLGEVGSYVELSSLHALLQESKRMHHCVPSYIDRCIDGEVSIFHLQLKGPVPERATLELRRQGARGWLIAQLKGPCNAPVTPAMHRLATMLLGKL
ncbi:PcfJ domain-containing protein [Limnobacter sp.]|uniref:PcfJ domain-containing protein n=1 Tax=Limnobacter sp. TaxID=2003368 RepID=UPI00351612E7